MYTRTCLSTISIVIFLRVYVRICMTRVIVRIDWVCSVRLSLYSMSGGGFCFICAHRFKEIWLRFTLKYTRYSTYRFTMWLIDDVLGEKVRACVRALNAYSCVCVWVSVSAWKVRSFFFLHIFIVTFRSSQKKSFGKNWLEARSWYLSVYNTLCCMICDFKTRLFHSSIRTSILPLPLVREEKSCFFLFWGTN